MAADNLKDFSIQWIILGLLFFCLVAFATLFTSSNNPDALGASGDKFDTYSADIQGRLLSVEGTSNSLLNLSAQNDPEASYLGSRESVATSYGIMGTSRIFLSSLKLFFGWIISGTAGQILITVFVGIFGIAGLYFITKWIRQGA